MRASFSSRSSCERLLKVISAIDSAGTPVQMRAEARETRVVDLPEPAEDLTTRLWDGGAEMTACWKWSMRGVLIDAGAWTGAAAPQSGR